MHRPPTYRFVDGVSRHGPTSSALSHQDRNSNPHPGLVKQAYSAWVTLNPKLKPQKWHLTAYFTYADLPSLPTIDKDPMLRKIIVPGGIYRCGKARSRNEEDRLVSRYESRDSPSPGGWSGHRVHKQLTLPSLHAIVGPQNILMTMPSSPGARMTEDQRVIQVLNSRHIS